MFAARRRRKPILEIATACGGDERVCHRWQGIAIGQDESYDLAMHRLDKIEPHQIVRTVKHIEKCVWNNTGEASRAGGMNRRQERNC